MTRNASGRLIKSSKRENIPIPLHEENSGAQIYSNGVLEIFRLYMRTSLSTFFLYEKLEGSYYVL